MQNSIFDNLKLDPNIFMNLKTGNILNEYSIEKTIGEGSFGKVCLVIQKRSGMLIKNNFIKNYYKD